MNHKEQKAPRSAIAKSRLRLKLIVWPICVLVLGGVAVVLWNELRTAEPWQLLLLVVPGALLGWKFYRQANSARR